MRKPRQGKPPAKLPTPPGSTSASGNLGGGQHSTTASGGMSQRGTVHHTKALKPVAPPKPKRQRSVSKSRMWSPGADVACCSAEALGTLLGWDWQQVLELYWRTAADADAGASILDTLSAGPGPVRASDPQPYSICCFRLNSDLPGPGLALILGVQLEEPHAIAVTPDGTWHSWGEPFSPQDWPDLIIEEAWCLR